MLAAATSGLRPNFSSIHGIVVSNRQRLNSQAGGNPSAKKFLERSVRGRSPALLDHRLLGEGLHGDLDHQVGLERPVVDPVTSGTPPSPGLAARRPRC